MLAWIIITFGNWWLAKLIVNYTTKWRLIIPLGLLAVITSSAAVIAMQLFSANEEASVYGEKLSDDTFGQIVVFGGLVALFWGLIILFISILVNRRKIMKRNIIS